MFGNRSKRSRQPLDSLEEAREGSQLKKRNLGKDGSLLIDDKSLLVKTLRQHKLFLHSDPQKPHLLGVHQVTFLKNFTKDLSLHLDYPSNVDSMLETLFELMRNQSFLRNSLSSTKTSPGAESVKKEFQDSFLRLMLCVPDMQTKLLHQLIDLLGELAKKENRPTQRSQLDQIPLPRLILSAIRFLPTVEDGSGLVEQIMNILPSCTLNIQREIILSLPEILDDAQHEKAAESLRIILDDNAALTSIILDCLATLSLSGRTVSQIFSLVLKRLERIKYDDLPVIVNFIINSIQEGEAVNVVQELRDRLNLVTTTNPDRQKESKDVQCIIIEAICLQANINKAFYDAWIKCIEGAVEDVLPLDIVILVSFQSIPGRRKVLQDVAKKKIRCGQLGLDLLRKMLVGFGSVVKKYFNEYVKMCDTFLGSVAESIINRFGMHMFVEAFASLGGRNTYFQQQLVGDLVCSVGTGGGGLITTVALSALEMLAEQHSQELIVFATLVTALMDYTENMTLGQFRQLMHILSTLAWGTQLAAVTVDRLQDEIKIMTKKQLGNKSTLLKKKGVIAVVSMVRAMCKHNTATGSDAAVSCSTSSSGSRSTTLDKEIIALITTTMEKTSANAEAAGLFMDEMASPAAVTELNSGVTRHLSRLFKKAFEDEFIAESNEVQESRRRPDLALPTAVCFKLGDAGDDDDDDDEVGDFVIPIARWIQANKVNPSFATTEIFRFIPTLRLLGVIETDHVEINALLSCGVVLVSDDYLEGRAQLTADQAHAVADIIFFCLNWFRELLNLFSKFDKDEETRKDVRRRLKNILCLEDSLRTLLAANPTYRPPSILFSENTADWTPAVGGGSGATGNRSKAGKKKGKGKKSKPAARLDESSMNATLRITSQSQRGGPAASSTLISQASQDKTATTTGEEAGKLADLSHYRPFFRELDLSVFNILNFVVVRAETDLAFERENSADPALLPSELLFLLRDLSAKVDRRLISSHAKKKGFPARGVSPAAFGHTNLLSLSEASLAEKVAGLLPKLFANLDLIKDHFEQMIVHHDGVLDSGDMYNETARLNFQCLRHGFDIATAFFAWNGFQAPNMAQLLTTCLASLVERIAVVDVDTDDLKNLAERTVTYLLTFTDKILDSQVAGSHIALLDALARLVPHSKSVRRGVAETALTYCKRSWRTALGKDQGAKFSGQVERFFATSLEYCYDPTAEMAAIFDVGVEDVFENRGKAFSNDVYQTISSRTLAAVYQVCLVKLTDQVRKLTYGVTKDVDELLEAWSASITQLQKMILPLKVWRNRAILKAVLKYSKAFLDFFLKNCMILFENTFKRKAYVCIEILKTLQSSTRYLQIICGSTKADKDIALTSYVPLLRKSLEAIVFRVQAMLAANKCEDAFWLGNLKNKDLKGEEIHSQASIEQNEDEEEENDEDEDEADVDDVGAEDGDNVSDGYPSDVTD